MGRYGAFLEEYRDEMEDGNMGKQWNLFKEMS